VAETLDCPGCGAPGLAAGSTCDSCGAEVPTGGAADDHASGVAPEARDAKRIGGLAVPLVAAIVVAGIGLPLTAVAVTLVNRTNEPEGARAAGGSRTAVGSGRARLLGAVAADATATPVGCRPGEPLLIAVGQGDERYSILLSVPMGATVGTYSLGPGADAFITVVRTTSGQSWTSRDRNAATGEITLHDDRRASARFRGLEASSERSSGTVEGAVEVRCG